MKTHIKTALMALIASPLLFCLTIHAATRKDLLETTSRYLCCLKGQKPQGADAHPLLKEDSGHSESPAGAGAGAGAGTSLRTRHTRPNIPACLEERDNDSTKNYNETYYQSLRPLEPFFERGVDAGAQKEALEEEIERLEAEKNHLPITTNTDTRPATTEETDPRIVEINARLTQLKKKLAAYWILRRTNCTCNTEKTDIVAEALHAALLHKTHIEYTLRKKNEEIEALKLRLGGYNVAIIGAIPTLSEERARNPQKWLEATGKDSEWLYKDVMVRILQEEIVNKTLKAETAATPQKRESILLGIKNTKPALSRAIEDRDKSLRR